MSDKTLDQLIETIKSEAIEAAEVKAKAIIDKAQTEAETIVHNAKQTREELIKSGEEEAESILSKGQKALQQAARDLSITLQNDIKKLLDAVLQKEVDDAFSPELMQTAILTVVDQIGGNSEVKLPEVLHNDIAAYIHKQLKDAKTLPKLSIDTTLVKGFSITKKDAGWSYEITPKEIADLLNTHLSSKWVELLKNNA
ncbi:HrpE/YscL family type III secretion apparatus protein [Winogradskyella helgolandensis]|uniref:HrpE/YscL family type III secretion apparatus protein n=1 Tax=Winogradskyella helgolandensis TaxID=2697010 RepID=UPI0015B8A8E1|nr:HrpE/YscL family type III secretion apparatus protein [Winogradskyella helgolandensis]